jgi:hypothetical protein
MVALGRYVFDAATKTENRAVLLDDPTFALQQFCEPFPDGHRIVVIPETKNMTVMKLPLAEDVIGVGPNTPNSIYETLGEYILKNCR